MSPIIINTDFANIHPSNTPSTLPEWTLFRILFNGDRSAARITFNYNAAGFNYTLLDRQHRSFLHAAAYGNVLNATKFLLEQGTPLHEFDDQHRSVLHYAAFKAEVPLIQCLLENNIDIHAADNFNRTALHYAVYNPDVNVTRYLLEQGADALLESQDNNNLTPLYSSVLNNKTEILTILLDHGANHTVFDPNHWAPLHWASYFNFITSATQLLLSGADVDLKTNEGWTPLQLAVYHAHSDMVKQLINFGADLLITNTKQETALDVARRQRHVEIASYLEQRLNTTRKKRATNSHEHVHGNKITPLPHKTISNPFSFIHSKLAFFASGEKQISMTRSSISSSATTITPSNDKILLPMLVGFFVAGKKFSPASFTENKFDELSTQVEKAIEKYDESKIHL